MNRKSAMGGDARLAALFQLSDVLDRGANGPDPDLDDARDLAYSRRLTWGVLRWLSALEWIAAELIDKPLKKKDRDVQRLVLLGIYQLWKDGTAGHAAVNETAACARKIGKPWATGLINAVLRRFQREQEALLDALEGSEDRFAHPAWLLKKLREDWPEDWQAIVEANNRAAPLWLRERPGGATPATDALIASGLRVDRHPAVSTAVRIEPPRPVNDIPGFAEGRLSVQDPAAQLAAGLLDCQPGHRVLDACAAPGGKTGHLLERYPGIELLALDRSDKRLELVNQNLRRLSLENSAEVLAADAAHPDEWWDGRPFDRILLDAPCTATGVIRRHPEIKWLRTPGQLREVAGQQARLLDALWPLLRPGGMLLYATCSVLQAENGAQVTAFTGRHADAHARTIDADWGRESGPGRQVLPGEQEMDGFFYARIFRDA